VALIDGAKDRYSADDPVKTSYRDIKFFIKMTLADGKIHVCELPLNISTALVAKELGPPVYEIIRRHETKDSPVMIPQVTPGNSARS
jgi:hypothetical protein